MHPTETLRRLGGVSTWSVLLRHCEEADVRRLVASGDVVRGLPDVTVPRSRRPRPHQRGRARWHDADLPSEDLTSPGTPVTSRDRTLVDCLRTLDEAESLAVADSALRAGDVSPARLRALADGLAGAGAGRARRVAGRADGRAANPFESVLRHHALGVAGLRVVPQLGIHDGAFRARPDLVDPDLRLVLEADSHAFHSSRSASRACRRYTGLVARGWTVLRFSREDVLLDGPYVVATLARVLRLLR